MKKYWFILWIGLTMITSGCSSSIDLTTRLDQTIASTLAVSIPFTNHQKPYIAYYVPKDVGVLRQEETSTVFLLGNSEFLFTLNINAIIAQSDQPNGRGIDTSQAIYTNQGVFSDTDGQDHEYIINILDMGGSYYILLDTPKLSFYGLTNPSECNSVVKAMLRILKSSIIHDDTIIETFDRDEAAKSEKIELDLFDAIVPESGRLEEIVAGEITPTPTPSSTPVPSSSTQTTTDIESPIETEPSDTLEPTTTPSEVESTPSIEDIYQESGNESLE